MNNTLHDFEIERLEISSEEQKIFGKLVSQIRQQHLTLNGSLDDQEARLMVKLLNDINNNIYHTGGEHEQERNREQRPAGVPLRVCTGGDLPEPADTRPVSAIG